MRSEIKLQVVVADYNAKYIYFIKDKHGHTRQLSKCTNNAKGILLSFDISATSRASKI